VAYLIPTFGSAAIGRGGIILRHDLLFFSNPHVHSLIIPAMPKASDQLRNCSCLESGQEQGRCIEIFLVMQDTELLLLFFSVESLNPVASESVEYSVLNACLLRLFLLPRASMSILAIELSETVWISIFLGWSATSEEAQKSLHCFLLLIPQTILDEEDASYTRASSSYVIFPNLPVRPLILP
jgi:hypothetical protein